MKGHLLLDKPPEFPTFSLAHRLEGSEHWFEVAYGSSFSELYYDFSPSKFIKSTDRAELTLQLGRAGAPWLVAVLEQLASGTHSYTHEQLESLARSGSAAG